MIEVAVDRERRSLTASSAHLIVEGDNKIEAVRFDVPEVFPAQAAYVLYEAAGVTGAVLLGDDRLLTIGRGLTATPGTVKLRLKIVSPYDEVWNSLELKLKVRDVFDVDGNAPPADDPSALDAALTAMAEYATRAEAGKDGAQEAQAGAEAAHEGSEGARDAAAGSATEAWAAATRAELAESGASVARDDAQVARTGAQEAQAGAEAARLAAEAARADALEAQAGAEGAQASTEQARDDAQALVDAIAGVTVEAETLTPGSDATAAATIEEHGLHIVFGVPQGVRGPEGVQGPQGIQGSQGIKGDKGDVGLRGPQGVEGPQGPQGDTGPQGLQGDTGPQGLQGDTGPQGQQGVKGEKGDMGPQGVQGETGPQGLRGETGEQGPIGPVGPQGLRGETGADFTVKGIFATLAALRQAHPTGSAGDVYLVGTAQSSTAYMWALDVGDWQDIGPIQGPAGQSAYEAAQVGGYEDTPAAFHADLAAIAGLALALAAL